MDHSASVPLQRRTVLQAAGIAVGAGALSTAVTAQDSDGGRSFVLEQDDQCVPLTPLSGEDPLEDLYDYTYPTDRYDGPPGSDGSTFSSHGTTDLQRDDTSVLFLYDGPEGLSLVVVHGHLDGDGAGGTVTFSVRGLPAGGEWIVRDDYYLVDGEEAPSNFDNWDVDGDEHGIDWAYAAGRTDGGAFRGLGAADEVTVDPAFNEAAALSDDHDFGPVEAWEALSGDRDDPERHSLDLDSPVTIRQGECPPADDEDGDGDVDAQITDASVAGGTVTPGDVVPADVTVRNTSDREHTFFVGYTVIDPSGGEHHNDGTTDEPVTLAAGESRTVTVEWRVEGDVPRGTYDAVAAVWEDRTADGLAGRLDDRRRQAAFEVE